MKAIMRTEGERRMEREGFPLFILTENTVKGYTRVFRIAKEYEKKGYIVLVNEVDFGCGVDVLVVEKKTGCIVGAIESTNWARAGSYMDDVKFARYLTALNRFDVLPGVKKELHLSYRENLRNKKSLKGWEFKADERMKQLKENSIEVKIYGYQDLDADVMKRLRDIGKLMFKAS
jgi:hypothetical protein